MKIASLLACLILTLSSAQAEPGGLGVGVEGTPTSPAPALRVYITEDVALNFTLPSLRVAQSPSYDDWGLDLGFAILPMQRTRGQVRHGPRFGAFISQYYADQTTGPGQQGYGFGVNVGWDLEYLVAAVPGLSVGGNVGVRYAYSWREAENTPDYYDHTLGGIANSFNLRYYF